MSRDCQLLFAVALIVTPSVAQNQANASKGSDATQSFVSPLGLGSGATVAVTQTGPTVTAALARQMVNPTINFWQIGFSGTTDTNGQTAVYSSKQSDAPGFKGKVGFGKSSFIQSRPVYTRTEGEFRVQAWCRDVLNQVNKTLPLAGQTKIDSSVRCKDAVAVEQAALKATPPVGDDGKVDSKAQEFDQRVLDKLKAIPDPMSPEKRQEICQSTLKSAAEFYQFCPDSGKPQKSIEDEHVAYPGLDIYAKESPSKFQWKVWASWSPVLTSTSYRPVTNGAADLSNKQSWTHLLNSGTGDWAIYYGFIAVGIEGGYGETVDIKAQNICNNTTSGTYTAQQCSMAMVGKPLPKNSGLASTTLQLAPLPLFGKSAALSSGSQIQFSYVAPLSGGHSSEIGIPFYLSPSSTQTSFVVGIQPTWDWNTDPKVGNKFSVTVFVGARPSLTRQ